MDFAEDWCGLEDWQAGARYQLRRLIGSGSYGDVAEGLDVKTNQPVAIKRVQNIVESVVDAKRIYREIYILGKMSHPNVIRLISVEAPLLSPQISDPNTPPPSDKVLSNENNSDEGHRKRWRTQKLPDSNQDHALDDLYMVFELVDTDLNKLLLSAQYLSTLHIQTFLYQILLGVHYLHSANVIHRDLKPANILLYENCDLKICDFGLSRLYNDPTADINNSNLKSVISENGIMNDSEGNHLKRTLSTSASKESIDAPRRPARNRSRSTDFGMSDMLAAIPQRVRKMTNHVVTRWYRAPELILLCDYTKAVDMWSVGCIMAELLGMMVESISDYQDRTPLFPGTSCPSLSGDGLDNIDPFGSTTTSQQGQGKETEYDRLDQLNLILDVIGTPSEEDVRAIQNPAKERYLLEQMPFRNAQNLSDKYPGAPAEALDLLAQMLHFNPVKRLTVEEALAHPYLSPVRDLSEETVFEGILKMDIETTPLVSSDEIRENLKKEIFFHRS